MRRGLPQDGGVAVNASASVPPACPVPRDFGTSVDLQGPHISPIGGATSSPENDSATSLVWLR